MRSKSLLSFPAVILATLAFSSCNLAQAAAAPESHEAKVEHRIRDIFATLHITKAQKQEWNAFADVMMDNAEAMEATVQQHRGDPSTLSASQILENYAAISVQHGQNVERLAAAFSVLYASLSPKQKHAADEMFRNYSKRQEGTHKHAEWRRHVGGH